MADSWRPEWVLEAWSTDAAARVEFSPSYVHAGSATGTLTRGGVQTTYGPAAHNGYEGEWRRLAGIVHGTAEPVPVQTVIDDLRFANLVADAASAVARRVAPGRSGGRPMTALSVLADPAARHAGQVDEVIASLPLSLTHAPGRAAADVVAIAGDANWPAQAVSAIEDGARAVLIVRPVDADTTDLARAALDKSVVVVIDTPWAGNPGDPRGARTVPGAARSGGSLELRLVVPTNDVLQLRPRGRAPARARRAR